MGLRLALGEGPYLEARYDGPVDVSSRLVAKELMAASAAEAGVNRVLIDLRDAEMQPYGVNEALRVTRRVASLTALRRLAYVLPRCHPDMIASVLTSSHGSGFVSIFGDRQSALTWLARMP